MVLFSNLVCQVLVAESMVSSLTSLQYFHLIIVLLNDSKFLLKLSHQFITLLDLRSLLQEEISKQSIEHVLVSNIRVLVNIGSSLLQAIVSDGLFIIKLVEVIHLVNVVSP